MEETVPDLPAWKPILACLTLSVVFVTSLYVWSSPFTRNEPATIRKRFFSVFVISLISPCFLWYFLDEKYLQKNTLCEILGLRLPGLLPALLLPLLLTMILFLGPIAMQGFGGLWQLYAGKSDPNPVPKAEDCTVDTNLGETTNEPKYWWSNVNDLMWLRNFVVAPLSEEFTFRACMLPLLLQVFSPTQATFIAPLFFGAAHFNHMLERIQVGMEWKQALFISCFQFSYTYLFGAYSAFLFQRTGHFVAPSLVHAFCNHMGFPDFGELIAEQEPKRSVIVVLGIIGFVCWWFLLLPMTSPTIYSNNLFWR